ncbi:uncharacterized protein [Cherax quadricarinatus]|uniref:uncharacterized protein n=1 Tax=Cherax quadricarinatus TaxID=27406 RepID=UPI00387EC3F2
MNPIQYSVGGVCEEERRLHPCVCRNNPPAVNDANIMRLLELIRANQIRQEQMICELMGLLGARSTQPPTHPYGDAVATPPTNETSPRPHVDVETVPPTQVVDVNAFIQDIVTPTHAEIDPSPQSHMSGECVSSCYCDKCVWSEMEYFMTNSQPTSCMDEDSPINYPSASPINYPPASPPEVYCITDEEEDDDPEQNAQKFYKRRKITLR